MIGQTTTQQPAGMENAMMRFQTAQADKMAGKNLPKNLEAIEKTAKEFEAVFLSQMMSHMFEGLEADSMFGGGQAEKIYQGMMVNEYAQDLANNGGVGIADEVAKYMLRVQEAG